MVDLLHEKSPSCFTPGVKLIGKQNASMRKKSDRVKPDILDILDINVKPSVKY